MNPSQANTSAALSTPVPTLSPGQLQALAQQLYGMVGDIRPLAGERDQNSCLRTEDGRRYVLKVSNPSEPTPLVEFQIAALDHVAQRAPDQPVPRVVRTLDGRTHDAITLPDGSRSTVRMLTYLDGIQIRETPRTTAQRRLMGRGLAQLNRAMGDFRHPAAQHDLLWNVSTAHRLGPQLDSLVDPARRALAGAFMDRFITHVLPRLPSLRAQVIHNDYHLYNVLVSPDDHERITGIIDFGDMLHAPLVGEAATAAAFHMAGSADPFDGPAQFLGAYAQVLPFTDAELEVLADLMATRHLITALISEWRALKYPENRAYIMRHNPAAWEALSLMADMPRHALRDRLLIHVCNPTTSTTPITP